MTRQGPYDWRFFQGRLLYYVFNVRDDHYMRRSNRPPMISFERDNAYVDAIRQITGYPS